MDNQQSERRPFRLLFVCTGNTCRSPLAEVIARRRIAELGWKGVEVRSAGVGAFQGSAASGGSIRAAAGNGLDLRAHEATLLTREATEAADLILTMSATHLERVAELGGGDRAAIITSFAAGDDGERAAAGVPDPIGGPDDEYQETFDFLSQLMEGVLGRLGPMVKT